MEQGQIEMDLELEDECEIAFMVDELVIGLVEDFDLIGENEETIFLIF
jgi:hypothetical protein